MAYFKVTLRGRGFEFSAESGEIVRGFYTFRKVEAATPAEARITAVRAIECEPRVQGFIRETQSRLGSQSTHVIQGVNALELTWLGRFLHRVPTGFIFYQEDEDVDVATPVAPQR